MKSFYFVILFLIGPSLFAKEMAYVQGIDALYTLSESVKLVAKVEKSSLSRRDIYFERVNFYKGKKFLGSAKTYGDGLAKIYTKRLKEGVHTITAVMSHKSKYVGQDKFTVAILKKNTKILVSDIDHTISDASGSEVLALPNSRIYPLDQASEYLNKLSKKYFVIYITARDDYFMKKTRDWLKLYKFPVGPSFYWDFQLIGGDSFDHGVYKTNVIRRLKRKFKNITVGVGDRPHDILAYLSNGMKSYYIGDRSEYPDRRAKIVNHWKEIYLDLIKK